MANAYIFKEILTNKKWTTNKNNSQSNSTENKALDWFWLLATTVSVSNIFKTMALYKDLK